MMLSPCNGSHRVCRVGYALNPKKLRKSAESNSDPIIAVDSNTLAEPSVILKVTSKSIKKEWQGGGLADILTDHQSGIIFEPFEYDSRCEDMQV